MLVKDSEHEIVKSLNGNILKQVDDFKYLGSYIYIYIYIYISSSKKDFASHYMDLWHLNQNKNKLVQNLFKSKLLYGSETWTMSKQLEKRLDGTYTRLLMRVQNIDWKHFTLEQIYVSLPKASHVVKSLRRSLSTCEEGNHV